MGESRDAQEFGASEVGRLNGVVGIQWRVITRLEREIANAEEAVEDLNNALDYKNDQLAQARAERERLIAENAQLRLENSQIKIINGVLREGLAKVAVQPEYVLLGKVLMEKNLQRLGVSVEKGDLLYKVKAKPPKP